MKKLTTVILTLTLLLTLTGLAFGADVLNIGSGARSIALGRTYTSTVADGYGIFGNPASLKGLTTGEVVSMYGTYGRGYQLLPAWLCPADGIW